MSQSLLRDEKRRVFLFYATIISVTLLGFWWIQIRGNSLSSQIVSPLAALGAKESHKQLDTLLHFLLALAVVIIVARAMGSLFKVFHEPPVIGEVIGGIILGPSLLGRFFPEVQSTLLPSEAVPFLGIMAQLGVIFYMFLIGLEFDLKVLRRSGHATMAISHASIMLPFLFGGTLSLWLFQDFKPTGVPFITFALFLGVSMSVTAFPVLARILSDKKVTRTRMGAIALTCAAVDDVTAWVLLAFVVSMAKEKIGGAFITLVLTVVYICLMFYVGRPLIAKLVPYLEKLDRLTEGGMAIIFVALLLSALATEMIGIHAIFGAFCLGAVTPHSSRIAKELSDRLEDLVRVLFLPAFFAFTGLRTQIGLLDRKEDWVICGVLILVATLGKFGGTFVASKFVGLNTRDSAAMGILMNTRGLVELIVLNIGLDLKIITPTLFAMLVIMALVTTFITSPIFTLLTRNHPWTEEPIAAK